MIRVLLADDQVLVRDGFRSILDRDVTVEVVGEAANGLETLELVDRTAPDVVLLDLDMPRMDGLTALPRIKEASPSSRVVIFSGRPTEALDAFQATSGAAGCIGKDEDWSRIIETLAAVVAARHPASAIDVTD